MVPAGGANAEGWLAFRDVLARIEAYTSRAAPAQVILSIRYHSAEKGPSLDSCKSLHAMRGEL